MKSFRFASALASAPLLVAAYGCAQIVPQSAQDSVVPIPAGSYQFTLTFDPSVDAGIPTDAYDIPDATPDAWLRLDTVDDTHGTATISRYGEFAVGTYVREGSAIAITFDSFGEIPTISSTNCEPLHLRYAAMHLTGYDDDDDGDLDRIAGTASGSATIITGDYGRGWDFEGTIAASPDDRASAIVLTSAYGGHPFAPITARLDEAIPAPALDLLDDATGTVLEVGAFVRVGNASPAAQFTRALAPLPWGATLRVAVPEGTGLDGDGHAPTPATFTVATEPAIFDTPTFEGNVSILTFGARVIDNTTYPTWPAIEGTQALDLPLDGSAIVTFDSTSETELVLRVRFGSPPHTAYPSPVLVRFFDPDQVSSTMLDPPSGLTWTTNGGAGVESTDVGTLTVPLPSFAVGHRFGVEVRNPTANLCGWLPSPPVRILVEELRIQ